MSKKNNYQTATQSVTTDNTVETIDVTPVQEEQTTESEETVKEETVEAPVETTESSVNSASETSDVSEDTETVGEPLDVVPAEDSTDDLDNGAEDEEEEVDFSDLPDNIGDEADVIPEADVTNPDVDLDEEIGEVDPLPEEEGIYYCEVTVGFNKRSVVESRLEKYNIPFIVTATGSILVGSYKTEEEAVQGRKLLLTRVLKGTVVTYC